MRAASISESIVAFLTAFFIFSHRVAGQGGWYIDEESCHPDAVRFLESKLQRAHVGHQNLAAFLTRFDPNNPWNFPELPGLLDQVLGGVSSTMQAWRDARVLFAGGFDRLRNTGVWGLRSWDGAVGEEKTKDSPNGLVAWPFPFFKSVLFR